MNLFSRSSPFIQLIDYDSSLCEGAQYFIDLEDYTGLLGEWITPTSPNALQLFEESGDYIYSLRNGINGCPVLDTVSIEFIFCDNSCTLNFPSAFRQIMMAGTKFLSLFFRNVMQASHNMNCLFIIDGESLFSIPTT